MALIYGPSFYSGFGFFLQSLIAILVMIPLGALILMFSTKIFKLQNTSYKTAIKISFILEFSSIILLSIPLYNNILIWSLGTIFFYGIPTILAIWLINKNYQLTFKKSLLVWISWLIVYVIVSFGVTFLAWFIFSLFYFL